MNWCTIYPMFSWGKHHHQTLLLIVTSFVTRICWMWSWTDRWRSPDDMIRLLVNFAKNNNCWWHEPTKVEVIVQNQFLLRRQTNFVAVQFHREIHYCSYWPPKFLTHWRRLHSLQEMINKWLVNKHPYH